MVPLSARENRPSRSAVAPVKAPLRWPNISLSKSEREMPPRFTFTNGAARRRLLAWSVSAISSLPVPFSPIMSTGASVAATRLMLSSTRISAGLSPMMRERSKSPGAVLRVSSSAVATRLRSMRLSQGLVMKSNAPACTPSTARGMLPHAVMRMTGTEGWKTFI